jgi:glycosyltransferase involved in cell wall biosynthesis
MRIALFSETFVPKVDGIVTTLCHTLKHLRNLGHEVLIIAPAAGIEEYEESRIVGVKGRSFALYPELTLSLPRASLREALREFQPDIIHAADPVLLGLAALYYGGDKGGGALGVPLVISYHTDLPKYLPYFRMGFLKRLIWPLLRIRHNRAALNLCTSVAMIEQLQRHGIERVALWPGGVDTDRFQPCRRSEQMRLRLSDGNPSSPLLLYVGRLSAEKEIERLKPILEALPGVRLALVGDGPHRESLRRHFSGLPVFMAGFMHGDELASAFASSDLLVMPSRTETLGLVILEAMASGLPVVAARAGGIPELIEDGVNGYLFDRESAAAEIIGQLLRSAEEAELMRRNARAYSLEHNWREATCRLLDHYQRVCERFSASFGHPERTRRAGPMFHARQMVRSAAVSIIRKLLP